MIITPQALIPTAMLSWRLAGRPIEWFTAAAPRTFETWRRFSHEFRWKLGRPRFLPGARLVTKVLCDLFFVGKLAAMLAVMLIGISLGLIAVVVAWTLVAAAFGAELAIRLAPRVFSLRRTRESLGQAS